MTIKCPKCNREFLESIKYCRYCSLNMVTGSIEKPKSKPFLSLSVGNFEINPYYTLLIGFILNRINNALQLESNLLDSIGSLFIILSLGALTLKLKRKR